MSLRLCWDDPAPVFLDFETQSTADIKEVGGRNYAEHWSTRVLSLVLDIDGTIHVWLPNGESAEMSALRMVDAEAARLDRLAASLRPRDGAKGVGSADMRYTLEATALRDFLLYIRKGDTANDSYTQASEDSRATVRNWNRHTGGRVSINGSHELAYYESMAESKLGWALRLVAQAELQASYALHEDEYAKLAEYGIPKEKLHIHGTYAFPAPLAAACRGRTLVAHNALGFDRFIWDRFIGHVYPAHAWADTLLLARSAGLPGSLDKLARATDLGMKDSAKLIAHKLFKATLTPTGCTYPELLPGMVGPLIRYNVVDVILLRRIWERLAEHAVEADVIDAHAAVNDRGVAVDTVLLRKIAAVAARSAETAADKLELLTNGALSRKNFRSVPQVQKWLRSQGVSIADSTGKATLRKDVVEQCLAEPARMIDDDSPFTSAGEVPPVVMDVLRLRSVAIRITGAKAERAAERMSSDGRLRDLFGYHQAHTGRWSSSGVQVHNLPRPKKGLKIDELIAAHEDGRWPDPAGKMVDPVIGYNVVHSLSQDRVDDALSALVRPCLRASPNNALLIVDYAAVESRGIAWLAGEQSLLDLYTAGRDVYCEFASMLFGREIVKGRDDRERQIGKVVILGCGYGLGAEKFGLYCALQAVDLAAAGVTPVECVERYRAAYPAIAGSYSGAINGRPYRRGGIWDRLNTAALTAVAEQTPQQVGRIGYHYTGEALVCTLPSGRELWYRNCRIEDRVPGYCLTMGIEPKTKATLVYDAPQGYESQLYGGKLAENVTQAVCRDLLADALVRAESAGFNVVLHVHDEIVAECSCNALQNALQNLCRLMSTPPAWADGFPVAVEGFASPRYTKSAPHGYPTCEALNGTVHK